MYCKNCGAEIDEKAEICPKCGVRVKSTEKKSSGIAAIASFFIPGLGQIYNGQILKGILFLIIIPVSVLISLAIGIGEAQKCNVFMTGNTGCTPTQEGAKLLVIIMILAPIFWVYNIYDAYTTAEKINREKSLI